MLATTAIADVNIGNPMALTGPPRSGCPNGAGC
jgi:hypothetical protein